jgi:hypothetical protein
VEEYSDDKTERAHESTAKFKLSIEELEMLIEFTVCRRRDENLFCVCSISYYSLLAIGLIGSLENLSSGDGRNIEKGRDEEIMDHVFWSHA